MLKYSAPPLVTDRRWAHLEETNQVEAILIRQYRKVIEYLSQTVAVFSQNIQEFSVRTQSECCCADCQGISPFCEARAAVRCTQKHGSICSFQEIVIVLLMFSNC